MPESIYINQVPFLTQRSDIAKQGIYFSYKASYWQTFAVQFFHGNLPLAKINFYHDLQNPLPINVGKQIELDLPRTFPGNTIYSTPSRMKHLRQVLHVCAIQNPFIGYCQSMSHVASILLLLYPKSGVVSIMNLMIRHIIPEYWTQNMNGVITDAIALERLFSKKLPELFRHFQDLRIDVPSLTTGWFMTLYSAILPLSTTLRLWDYFFTKGSCALIKTAFCFFSMYQQDLLAQTDLCEVDKFLKGKFKSFTDWTLLTQEINACPLSSSKIRKYQKRIHLEVESRSKERMIQELKRTNFTEVELEKLHILFTTSTKHLGGNLPNSDLSGLLKSTLPPLSLQDLARVLYSISYPQNDTSTQDSLDSLHRLFDTNTDGAISFKEFCLGLCVFFKGPKQDKLKFAFMAFDYNNNGTIEKEEMLTFLQNYYKVCHMDLQSSDASKITDEVFLSYNTSKDNKLSFDDFCTACDKEPLLKYIYGSQEASM
uniref:Rab-GAP TBC domain-containing protein n=1 Tax=Arcella intermedia TaxID=1963864 RepID=A0A6B2L2D8_9EUKA